MASLRCGDRVQYRPSDRSRMARVRGGFPVNVYGIEGTVKAVPGGDAVYWQPDDEGMWPASGGNWWCSEAGDLVVLNRAYEVDWGPRVGDRS